MSAWVSSAEGDRQVAAVDFHRGGIAAEGAVRWAFVVEAEEGGEVGLGLDLGGVATRAKKLGSSEISVGEITG